MTMKANQWLSRFRVDITSNSNRIYANGRQQVEVTVTVEPRDGQTITDKQLDSIALLQLDDQGQFLLLDGVLASRPQHDERYEAHAATGSAPQNLFEASSNTRRRRFYVSSRHPGGTLSQIYAGIFMDEETHFETDSAPFKSSVIIESVNPHRFSADHFELTGQDTANIGAWDIDTYYLKFKNPTYRIVKTIAYGIPSGVVFDTRSINNSTWYNLGLTTSYERNCTAYKVGPETKHVFGGDLSVQVNDKPGMMTLIRTKLSIDGTSRPMGGESREWAGDSIWGVIDQHGNEHMLKFFTTEQGNLIDFKMHP